MNEQIKKLRKHLNFSQEKFGSKLGVTKTAISKMELGTYNTTDTMIKLICSNFNVNEEWLRYGTGEMLVEPDTFSLDKYADKHNLTSLELSIMKSYMELDEDVRHKILSSLKSIFNKESNNETSATKENDNTITSKSTDELEEEYKKRRSIDVIKQDATVLNSTEELKKTGNV